MYNQLEKSDSYLGFIDGMNELQKGRVKKILWKSYKCDGKIMERRDIVLQYLRNGNIPSKCDEIHNGKKKILYYLMNNNIGLQITKTEYEFANYLIENNLISKEAVNAYIDKEAAARKVEQEEAYKRLQEKKKEKEEADRRQKEFDMWLSRECHNYSDQQKIDIQKEIFIKYAGCFYDRAVSLLVLIDNIDKPMCLDELKRRLHRDNVASRKTFYHITGLRLPDGNRATCDFLDKINKNDYLGIVPLSKKEKVNNTHMEMFYVLNCKKGGGHEYVQTPGEAIEVLGIQFFIHKIANTSYVISSVECGMKIVSGKSKVEAVKCLKETCNKIGKDKIRQCIDNAVNRFGKSPYKTNNNKEVK